MNGKIVWIFEGRVASCHKGSVCVSVFAFGLVAMRCMLAKFFEIRDREING